MKKQRSSIDGFIPRQSNNNLGDIHSKGAKNDIFNASKSKSPRVIDGKLINRSGKPTIGMKVGRSDIDESLRDIDNSQEPVKKVSRRQRRRIAKMAKSPKKQTKKIVKSITVFLLLAVLVFGGYSLYKFIAAGNNIFQGNIFDIFQNQPLKQDSNGRSNFLVLGTSEDDPGHGGADLTDSMLVVSISQEKKDIYMFSVPRDLYVEYGMACMSGYSGKINAYFSCVSEEDTIEAEQKRLVETQKLVGDIFGLDIQYGVHVNHTVIKESVDAVGGIDVDIQGSGGAPGVLDRNFDWRCNYKCYLVKYDNGVHHLDGEHALFLSMARGDIAPTYGLGNSNFDREVNQQKILIALKDKAISTGTLTNVNAVTKLIDSFGNNLRTNIQTKEIRTLMQISSEVKAGDIISLSLFGDDNPVVTTGGYNGASVVMPSAGIFDYTDIKIFINKSLNSNPVVREAAPIMVLNGTSKAGFGQTKADELVANGFNVTAVDNAPDGKYDNVEIYQIGKDNAATAEKLTKIFNTVIKKTKPPVSVNGDIRFVLIFGVATE